MRELKTVEMHAAGRARKHLLLLMSLCSRRWHWIGKTCVGCRPAAAATAGAGGGARVETKQMQQSVSWEQVMTMGARLTTSRILLVVIRSRYFNRNWRWRVRLQRTSRHGTRHVSCINNCYKKDRSCVCQNTAHLISSI